jgi:hypothetical protein
MFNRLIGSVCVILGAGLALAGCRAQQRQEVVVLAQGPELGALSAPAEYAAAAIDAVGGLDAWTKTRQLQLDCVVTFYRLDGTFYLTEQSLNAYPWSNALEISAREPQGTFAWRLSKGQFEVLRGADCVKDMPLQVASRCFAEAILEIVTPPARLLDKSNEIAREDTAVKIHGQWYRPLKSKGAAEAVFYQNRDNSVVDMIQLACKAGSRALTVRGYDYAKVEKGGPAIPTKIEIFSSSADAEVQTRLVKIDCHRFVRIQ